MVLYNFNCNSTTLTAHWEETTPAAVLAGCFIIKKNTDRLKIIVLIVGIL